MIEGRSGGSGRGTRRELWAPPDSGSAQPADRTLYRVPTLDPSRSLRRPRISFLRRFLTRRTCLLATGRNSAAPKRTFSSALVSAEWRAQRENDRFCSGTAAAVVLRTDPDASRPPRPPRISLRRPPLRHRLHLHPGRRLKSSDRTHRTSALHPSPQSGGPKGDI